ncbi:nitroreductase family protein [Fluviicola taffensis]|uniref:Putative NAD(P)H nitroreductase n=1 Tax=Fluviicola taffensis (strain DSM 16823 / NCIMB 13979 / RW262) TaxID=755732 RepID=F2IIJ1_FLUTR|nr:nitroreductase [Fluviicola taffensis]AEA44917.1 nitroreductase [Fluviicola taffensis DSM 16823]
MRYNLSEVTAIIRDRRTIYPEQYSNRKIHKEQIELLLNNAVWAPTHGLTQPWRFIVFQENALVDLAETLGSVYLKEIPKEKQIDSKLAKLMNRPKMANAVIAIILHREEDTKISEDDDFAAISCAVQNMHLTATAQGIGAFWATPGIIKFDSFKNALGLTENQRCVGLFYLGYPAIEWPKGQRKPIEYLTEWKQ